MTLLGKIFTVLIFIASIVLMTVSVMVGASHKNWMTEVKDPINGLEAKVKLQDGKNEQLKKKVADMESELARERTSRASAIAALTTRALVQQDALDVKEKELADETANSQEFKSRMEQSEARLAQQDTQVKQLRTDLKTIVNDLHSQLATVVTLTDENHALRGSEQILNERASQLADDISRFKKVMDAFGLDKNSLTGHIPPKDIEGRITAVSANQTPDHHMVEVNLGSDDGLRKGHELDVYRGANYLGRLVITEVSTNRSVAQIVPDLNRGPIKESDRVTTRFRN